MYKSYMKTVLTNVQNTSPKKNDAITNDLKLKKIMVSTILSSITVFFFSLYFNDINIYFWALV